jgi:hypothetical protein
VITNINIVLHVLGVLILLTTTDGQIWKKNESKFLRRFTIRGWVLFSVLIISCGLLITKERLTVIRENEIEAKKLKAEMRLQELLEEKIKSTEKTLTALLKENMPTDMKPDTKIYELERNMEKYKDELSTLRNTTTSPTKRNIKIPETAKKKNVDEFSAPVPFQRGNIPTPGHTTAPSVPADVSSPLVEGQLKIVSNAFRVKKREPFIFQIQRFSKGKWITLWPEDVSIQADGKLDPIDGGSSPSFRLKGTGNTTIIVADQKGGATKCTVFFED